MGFFDLFKKKPQRQQHKEPDDFNPLDINSVIGYVKRQKPDASAEDVAKIIGKLAEPDADQDHLTPEGDLPWGWITVHKDFSEKISNEYRYFLNSWIESRKQSPRLEYAALKSFVRYMEEVRSLCKSKGECYEYWRISLFDDEYFNRRKLDLDRIGQNIENMETAYQKKQALEREIVPTLEKELLKIIYESPGILQKDLYKMFDADLKNYIQELLYFSEKNGKIVREKSGNTYKLFTK